MLLTILLILARVLGTVVLLLAALHSLGSVFESLAEVVDPGNRPEVRFGNAIGALLRFILLWLFLALMLACILGHL